MPALRFFAAPRRAAPWHRFLTHLLSSLVLGLAAAAAMAQSADADATLDAIRKDVDAAQKALEGNAVDADLLKLRQTALAAQAQAGEIATQLAPQLASLQARLTELGTPTPGAKEDPDIARQRAQLEKSRSALDAQIKLARLLTVEGEQLAGQAWSQRRSQFQARLGERTASILSAPFWIELSDDAPQDIARLRAPEKELASAARAAPWWAWVVVLAASIAVWPLRRWVDHRAVDLIVAHVPAGRLRRSLYAAIVVASWTFAFGGLIELWRVALELRHTLSETTASVLGSVAGFVWFGGYLCGLLKALIMPKRPSWRLLPLPDAVAVRMRRLPLQIALVSIFTRSAERLALLVNASLSVTVAINCFVALGLALALGWPLMRSERLWRQELSREGAQQRPLWRGAVAVTSWLVLVGSFVSVLAGYVAFGSFGVKQVLWTTVVGNSALLLAALIDDALMTWVAARPAEPAGASGEGSAASRHVMPMIAEQTRNQAAVLLSGFLRVLVVLVAMMLIVAPFGEGPTDLWRRSSEWQAGLAIGEVLIRPGALLQAVLVLGLGLLGVRVLRGWLADRYLPTTSLDPGMRVSAITLFGYAGMVVAASLALSAVGIGLERVAWVASALSVGIGFGLQAVVQNFVSGLILLAERPVKVGDWVSLGGIEGDIRRINVRATEIQMGDRSTVIVPNSEFITKVVRNVTLSDPLGLVQVKLPVPLGSDAEQVRDIMLAAFAANSDVLETPAPAVLLEGVDRGFLQFTANGFVPSPRMAGNVRSALLFDVLQRFGQARITLASPPTLLLGAPASAASSAAPTEAGPIAPATPAD